MENKEEKGALKGGVSVIENTAGEKYLTFFIDEQLFAIKSSYVVEIIRIQPITLMPKLPPYVKGVINLRGKIVTLIDLRIKLSKPELPYNERTSIIVVEADEFSVGFIVDRVNDVANIVQSQISETPKLGKDTLTNYVTGIATLEDGVAMVLSVMNLLSEKDVDVKPTVTDARALGA